MTNTHRNTTKQTLLHKTNEKEIQKKKKSEFVICKCIRVRDVEVIRWEGIYEGNFGGEPTTAGEVVPGDEVSTELRLGRSASSIDIARDRRPRPTKPASIGTPDTKNKNVHMKSSTLVTLT